jgi:hypothetical protein
MEQGCPGFLAFTPSIFAAANTPVDLSQLIAAIRTVPDPGVAPTLSTLVPPFQGSARPSTVAANNTWIVRYIVGLGGFLAGLTVFRFGQPGPVIGLIMTLGGLVLGLKTTVSHPVQKALSDAKSAWANVEAKWKQLAGNVEYLSSRREAEEFAKQAQNLPGEEAASLAGLQTKQRELQLKRYLDRVYINSARIKGVGNARKATLRSYGIETAADVQRQRIESISGFGPTTANALICWRTSIERHFVFNPGEPINPADIAAVNSFFAQKRRDLEIQLRQALSKLQLASGPVQASRTTIRNAAVSVWKTLKQAEFDIHAGLRGRLPQRIGGFAIAAVLWVLAIGSLQLSPKLSSNAPSGSSSPGTGSPPTPPRGALQDKLGAPQTPAPSLPNTSAKIPQTVQPNPSTPPPSSQLRAPPLDPPIELKPASPQQAEAPLASGEGHIPEKVPA